MTEPIHIISLGAGVQSSTMALMAAKGEITPMPEAAIFADTGDEPNEVYVWLKKLIELLPFPIHIVSSGKLSDNIVNRWDHSEIPAFFLNDDGRIGIGKRQCTSHFKIAPIRKKCRELSRSVFLWHGISVDEVSRAKDSGVNWLVHRWPLLELKMSRRDCLSWMKSQGYPEPPKSACVYCPYRSDGQWGKSKSKPEEWSVITKIDSLLNKRGEYLHSSCKRISEVDFSTEEERGQLNMFNNECEGMCGV